MRVNLLIYRSSYCDEINFSLNRRKYFNRVIKKNLRNEKGGKILLRLFENTYIFSITVQETSKSLD